MSYERPRSGKPLISRGSPVKSAGFYHDAIDIIGAFKRGELGKVGQATGLEGAFTVVKLRNETGGDRDRGHVLQLGEYLLDEVDFRYPWFEGNQVAEPAWSKYAILLEPAPQDELVRAQMSGICMAVVDVGHVDHRYAYPRSGQSKLKSGVCGPIEILHTPEGTGDRELFVRLDVTIPEIIGKLTDDVSENTGTTNWELWTGDKGSEADAGFTGLPSIFFRVAMTDGELFKATWIDRGLEGEPLGCSPS